MTGLEKPIFLIVAGPFRINGLHALLTLPATWMAGYTEKFRSGYKQSQYIILRVANKEWTPASSWRIKQPCTRRRVYESSSSPRGIFPDAICRRSSAKVIPRSLAASWRASFSSGVAKNPTIRFDGSLGVAFLREGILFFWCDTIANLVSHRNSSRTHVNKLFISVDG